jgi:hypothetical protein
VRSSTWPRSAFAGPQQHLAEIGLHALALGECVHRLLVVLDDRVDHRAGHGDPELGHAQSWNRDHVQKMHSGAECPGELAGVIERFLRARAQIGGDEDVLGQHRRDPVHLPGHPN